VVALLRGHTVQDRSSAGTVENENAPIGRGGGPSALVPEAGVTRRALRHCSQIARTGPRCARPSRYMLPYDVVLPRCRPRSRSRPPAKGAAGGPLEVAFAKRLVREVCVARDHEEPPNLVAGARYSR
jgi:hypothetical protein